MNELAIRPAHLDEFVRNRTDTVLIGKHNSSSRSLHIPSSSGSDDVACHAQTTRQGGWLEKPLAAYPPGYYQICPQCAEERFNVEVISDD